jgi:hypothetical protein
MGMLALAALAASAGGLPPVVTITSTCRRTGSAASSGRRSIRFSAQRNSMATFSHSTYPVSFNPRRNAPSRLVHADLRERRQSQSSSR